MNISFALAIFLRALHIPQIEWGISRMLTIYSYHIKEKSYDANLTQVTQNLGFFPPEKCAVSLQQDRNFILSTIMAFLGRVLIRLSQKISQPISQNFLSLNSMYLCSQSVYVSDY